MHRSGSNFAAAAASRVGGRDQESGKDGLRPKLRLNFEEHGFCALRDACGFAHLGHQPPNDDGIGRITEMTPVARRGSGAKAKATRGRGGRQGGAGLRFCTVHDAQQPRSVPLTPEQRLLVSPEVDTPWRDTWEIPSSNVPLLTPEPRRFVSPQFGALAQFTPEILPQRSARVADAAYHQTRCQAPPEVLASGKALPQWSALDWPLPPAEIPPFPEFSTAMAARSGRLSSVLAMEPMRLPTPDLGVHADVAVISAVVSESGAGDADACLPRHEPMARKRDAWLKESPPCKGQALMAPAVEVEWHVDEMWLATRRRGGDVLEAVQLSPQAGGLDRAAWARRFNRRERQILVAKSSEEYRHFASLDQRPVGGGVQFDTMAEETDVSTPRVAVQNSKHQFEQEFARWRISLHCLHGARVGALVG